MAITIDEILKNSNNVAELLSDRELARIGSDVVTGYKLDDDSLAEWKMHLHEALDIANQVMDEKSFPWPNASNIKFPLITMAAINYAARTLPEIVQNNKVVKANVVGSDPDGSRYMRSDRVSRFMSYQLLVEDKDWESDIDQFLNMWPIIGTLFKKTYYDPILRRNKSDLCTPDKIIVNYGVKSLSTARRITHKLTMYANDIIERQRRGLYLDSIDPELFRPSTVDDSDSMLNPQANANSMINLEDEDYAIEILECHCYLDLDEDGYKEPYIVTVHADTEQVLRIVPRFKDIEKSKKGEIIRITAQEFFTVFKFLPSFDGGFYGIGFGFLLLPINKAVNSLTNQLIDAGTLSVTQGGFLGGGIRIKDGDFNIRMGEWKVLNTASGINLSQNIVPIPVREPSQTILALLTMLIQIGKDLSSTTDALTGKEQAQNVSQGVINSLIEQGTKVFNAINKRLYRSLGEEFQKLYDLNSKHVSNKQYQTVLNSEMADVKLDFEQDSLDIYPVADPMMSTENQRLQKAGLIQQLATVDRRAADLYLLQSMQIEDSVINMLLPPPDPNAPPPPEVIKAQSEARLNDAKVAEITSKLQGGQMDSQLALEKLRQDIRESNSRISESQGRTWKMSEDVLNKRRQLDIAEGKMVTQTQQKAIDSQHKVSKASADLQLKAMAQADKRDKDMADTQIEAAKVAADIAAKQAPKKDEEDEEGQE